MNKTIKFIIVLLIFGGGYYLLETPSKMPAVDMTESQYSLIEARAQIADVEMNVDAAFLNAEERAVINKLIEAANLMSEIYLRQVDEANPEVRLEIANGEFENKSLLLDMFDLHFSPTQMALAFTPQTWASKSLRLGF